MGVGACVGVGAGQGQGTCMQEEMRGQETYPQGKVLAHTPTDIASATATSTPAAPTQPQPQLQPHLSHTPGEQLQPHLPHTPGEQPPAAASQQPLSHHPPCGQQGDAPAATRLSSGSSSSSEVVHKSPPTVMHLPPLALLTCSCPPVPAVHLPGRRLPAAAAAVLWPSWTGLLQRGVP